MMNFHSNKAIYLQIVDFIQNNILSGNYKEGDRISSIREIAVQMGVNPNTIMRSYTYLQQNNIIKNKRGVGYFIEPGAVQNIQDKWKKDFIEKEWPAILQKMELLNINLSDLKNIPPPPQKK